MPTYEYRCRGCDHRFERFQKMTDPPVRVCPSCGKRRAERLISTGGGLLFKGPGFYATDYRTPPPSEAESGSAGKGKGDGSKGDSEAGASRPSTKQDAAE